jgi:hypothetical protein
MKRHSTDLMSLVFGVIFLGVAGWWLVGQYVTVDVPHLGWITAAVLIVLGILGLAGSLRGERPAATPVTAPTSGPTVEMAPVPPASARELAEGQSGQATFGASEGVSEGMSGDEGQQPSGPATFGETPREDAPEADTPRDAPSDDDRGTDFR